MPLRIIQIEILKSVKLMKIIDKFYLWADIRKGGSTYIFYTLDLIFGTTLVQLKLSNFFRRYLLNSDFGKYDFLGGQTRIPGYLTQKISKSQPFAWWCPQGVNLYISLSQIIEIIFIDILRSEKVILSFNITFSLLNISISRTNIHFIFTLDLIFEQRTTLVWRKL